MRMEPSKIVLFDHPDVDSDFWIETVIKNPQMINIGLLGYVVLNSLDGSLVDHWIPILYVPSSPTAGFTNSETLLPNYIQIEDKVYHAITDPSVLEVIIWHELGHFYYGDGANHIVGKMTHVYDEEVRADRYAAEHTSKESVIKAHRFILENFHHPGEPGHTELIFRMAELGDQRSIKYSEDHHLDKSTVKLLGS